MERPTGSEVRKSKARAVVDPTFWDGDAVYDEQLGSRIKALVKKITPWMERNITYQGEQQHWQMALFTEGALAANPKYKMFDKEMFVSQGHWDEVMFRREFGCREVEGALAWMGYDGSTPHFLCFMPQHIYDEKKRRQEAKAEELVRLNKGDKMEAESGAPVSVNKSIEEKIEIKPQKKKK